MKKIKLTKKSCIILSALILLIVVICIIYNFIDHRQSQQIGFPNDKIYYNMSTHSLKKEIGDPANEYSTENGDKCYEYNLEVCEIDGECSFKFYKNRLRNVVFISKNDGIDKSTAKEITERIKKYYENKDGFRSEDAKQDSGVYTYSFGIEDENGATGKYVTVELNFNGKLSINAEYLF